jgi:hypothetical protein
MFSFIVCLFISETVQPTALRYHRPGAADVIAGKLLDRELKHRLNDRSLPFTKFCDCGTRRKLIGQNFGLLKSGIAQCLLIQDSLTHTSGHVTSTKPTNSS